MLANIGGQDMAREQALASAAGLPGSRSWPRSTGRRIARQPRKPRPQQRRSGAQRVANFENLGLNRDMAANQQRSPQAKRIWRAKPVSPVSLPVCLPSKHGWRRWSGRSTSTVWAFSARSVTRNNQALALAAEQARINESNLASQQAIANMLGAQGLGSNYPASKRKSMTHIGNGNVAGLLASDELEGTTDGKSRTYSRRPETKAAWGSLRDVAIRSFVYDAMGLNPIAQRKAPIVIACGSTSF